MQLKSIRILGLNKSKNTIIIINRISVESSLLPTTTTTLSPLTLLLIFKQIILPVFIVTSTLN